MNWPTAPLGKLCEMDRQGVRPDDHDAPLLPFVGVENVEAGSGAISLNTGRRVGSQKSTCFLFDERHVLYGKLRPYLNKVATPEFVGKCSTELIPLRPRVGVDREFLGYLLRRQETVDHVMSSVTGARMPRTDMKALLSLPVPTPPLDEQRRIVAILNRVAKIERLRKRAQERLREFMPALFVRMFGDPVENPMGWPMRVLGDLCKMDRNTIKPSDPSASKLRFVGVENVDSGTGTFNFETRSRVGEQKSTAFLFDERHVLYGKLRPYLNKVATPDFDGRCSTELVPLLPRNGVNRDFLAELLRREETVEYVKKSVTGSRMPRTDMNSLLAMRIPAPPYTYQLNFAEIVVAAQAVADVAETGSVTASMLSDAFMSQLLEGGVAVPDGPARSLGSPKKVDKEFAEPTKEVR